jgi:hypothetical protein
MARFENETFLTLPEATPVTAAPYFFTLISCTRKLLMNGSVAKLHTLLKLYLHFGIITYSTCVFMHSCLAHDYNVLRS